MDFLNAFVALSNFVLIPAIAYGSQLALGALGVTLIYGILRFSNFAHGDTMAFGTMATVLITWWFQSMGISFGPLPTALLALPFGIAVCAALVLLTDRGIYRFYRRVKAKPIILVMASLGVMFIMNGLVRFIIGPDDQRFADGGPRARIYHIAAFWLPALIMVAQAIVFVVARPESLPPENRKPFRYATANPLASGALLFKNGPGMAKLAISACLYSVWSGIIVPSTISLTVNI